MFVTPPQMFTWTASESTKAEQVKRFCIDDRLVLCSPRSAAA
jgi:hypothetical protein